jgi:hypothetical protein
MSRYYDRNGAPISPEAWIRLFSEDYQRIATDTANDVTVSTVWLGLDHSFTADEPRQIFETMVFGGEHDQECWRYATEQEAREGHRAAVGRALGMSA